MGTNHMVVADTNEEDVVTQALQELEEKLSTAFGTSEWSLDPADLAEIELIDEPDIRSIDMHLGPLGGSRPRN